MAIVYGQEEDFRAKMQTFGAKLMQRKKGDNENENKPKRLPRKNLVKSKKRRCTCGVNYDPIKDNIQSIQSKVKFGRLVVYSVNCLANISSSRCNCDSIVHHGGIQAMKQVINHQNSNPAVINEVARTLKNIAQANSMYAEQIANDGILQQCIKMLHSNPNQTGIFAIDIMDSVLKASTDPNQKRITEQFVENNGLKILESVLLNNLNSPDLCGSIIQFMNTLMSINPFIIQQFADKAVWNSILNTMKCHPQQGQLAISGIAALKKFALINPTYSTSIQKSGAVGIISKCMQYNPDLKALTNSGATALQLLAGKNDISDALMVLLDFGKYGDVMITQALGLLGNLALIQENAQFIVAKGGLDCLMNLINYKCKKQEHLTADDVSVISNNVRAMSRLVKDAKVAQLFVDKKGVDLLKEMMVYYDDEESIMNAVVDTLGNLVVNNGKYLFGTDIEILATDLICKHPEYNIFIQKYGDLFSDLPLNKLVNAGLLKGLQESLLVNYTESQTVESIMNIIKQIVIKQPKLAQQIINDNVNGIIQCIRCIQCNDKNPQLLAKILDTMYEIGKVDTATLEYIKINGLEKELLNILSQSSLSDETAIVIKTFLDNVTRIENIDCDLSNLFMKLKGSGIDFNKLTTMKSAEQDDIKQIEYNIKSNDETLNYREYNTETLMIKMRESMDPKSIIGIMLEINERLQGGDIEIFNAITISGGIGDLLGQANKNMDNSAPLNATLNAIGTLSTDYRLKQLLGMHGTIRLILQVMSKHTNDIQLLDKCCYILSNLSFNNQQNMTSIIELGGVQDIVDIITTHISVNFICESAINVLVNLCHNSDKNKSFIARNGGGKACIDALKIYYKCLNDGDESVVISCFKCLANLAYIDDNIKQLIKSDVVAHIVQTMNNNTDKHDLIEMGVVVLANLSSHEQNTTRMINLNVLDLIIKISQTYPNEIEIQRSCLGCIANLMDKQLNIITFIDKKGHLRVYEIIKQLIFEESIIMIALKLIKILATNGNIATEMVLDGGCKIIIEIIESNKTNQEIIILGLQGLCKMIVTRNAAKYTVNDNLCDTIIKIAKDNNNWANIQIMNELIKVIVNVCSIENNTQSLTKNNGICIPLLRSIEVHKTNAIFLDNAAMALNKMSINPLSSKPLIKRGAIPVILTSMQSNPTRKGILTKYIKVLTNFLCNDYKSIQEITINNGYQIIKTLANQYPNYQPLQIELEQFEKAIKQNKTHYNNISLQSEKSQSIFDNLDVLIVRFITSGSMIKKYNQNGKSKKKKIRVNDNCNLLLFYDPTQQKPPKQLNLKSLNNVIRKKEIDILGMEKCNEDNSFVLISIDPNGREFRMGLECKTNIEMEKWVNSLQNIIKIMKQ